MSVPCRLLTEKEAAQLLNVTPSALRKWRNQRRGPEALRIGGGRAIRYPVDTLTAYLDSCPRVGGENQCQI